SHPIWAEPGAFARNPAHSPGMWSHDRYRRRGGEGRCAIPRRMQFWTARPGRTLSLHGAGDRVWPAWAPLPSAASRFTSVRAAGEAMQSGEDGLAAEFLDLLAQGTGLRRTAEDGCRELVACGGQPGGDLGDPLHDRK